MNNNADRLYNLLPAVYRIRDAETGWQLQALLRVIAEQVNVVEADIAQLYENWFIETCQDWVVPYIGDLVGYQQVHEAGEPGDISTVEGQERNNILISRSDVTNTIRYRRRKGTLALLEQLAQAVASWPYAHAVEFYKLLGVTQNDNFQRTERGRLIDIRDNHTLSYLRGPFASASHTVDVRRTVSRHSVGRYNIPSVGLFIWRLKVYPVVKTHAQRIEEAGNHCFTFSILGNDVPLYTNPAPRTTPDGQPVAVDELNFPAPITLRAFKKRLTDYYGDVAQGKSLQIWTIETPREDERDERHAEHHEEHHEHHEEHHEHHEHHEEEHEHQEHHEHHEEEHRHHEQHEHHGEGHGHHEHHEHGPELVMPSHKQEQPEQPQQPPAKPAPPPLTPVTPDRIIPADLSEWQYRPPYGKVAVDTQLGRIAFPPNHPPKEVFVSYYYAFSADIGGGAYHRPILQPANAQLFQVQKPPHGTTGQTGAGNMANTAGSESTAPTIYHSIKDALAAWEQWKQQNAQLPSPASQHGVIEIVDSGVYTEQLAIELEEYERLTIRAADRQRPVLRLVDWDDEQPDSFKVTGEYGSRFTLDGLLLTGRPVQFEGTIDTVAIRHCTIVPGMSIDSDSNAHHPAAPVLLLYQKGIKVNIEHSIVGVILIYQDEVREEPVHVNVSDSILDANSEQRNVISAPDDEIAYAILNLGRCTVFGQILVHAIDSAENSIFSGQVTVARRQRGCVRFCSIVPGSRTPRRYECQPDLVDQAVAARLKGQPTSVQQAAQQLERDRVRPRFNSTRYGKATYCQLAQTCAPEITRGADDESEMGVFHDLFQPQREINLRARLDDFTPAGMDTGIIYMS